MTWSMWLVAVLGGGLVVYLLLRFLYIWFFCGGNDNRNFYPD